jgi:hypothetical protein
MPEVKDAWRSTPSPFIIVDMEGRQKGSFAFYLAFTGLLNNFSSWKNCVISNETGSCKI